MANHHSNFDDVLYRILYAWIICFGALTLLVVSGSFLKPMVQPILAMGLVVAIWYFGTRNEEKGVNCSMLTHYTVYAMLISAAAMLVINLTHSTLLVRWMHDLAPQGIHYVTTLVVMPIAAVAFTIALYRRGCPEYCKACKAGASFTLRGALERNVFHHESKCQLRMACLLCWLLTVVALGCIFLARIDYRFESTGSFFFYVLPAGVFLLSVGYYMARTSNLRFELKMEGITKYKGQRTVVRYMVMRGDSLLLKEISLPKEGNLGLWDTPAREEMPHRDDLTIKGAEDLFRRISGAEDFFIRHLFNRNTVTDNSFHYAAILPEDGEAPELSGEWFSLYEVDVMLKSGQISRPFAFELHRIYTITMAWKTYDREGHRLYPIKRYRPTFRLSDMKEWDVDYDDLTWMNVAENNQDKPFYGLRQFWRRYVTGIEGKWGRKSS